MTTRTSLRGGAPGDTAAYPKPVRGGLPPLVAREAAARSRPRDAFDSDDALDRALEMMGGEEVFAGRPATRAGLHALALGGVPAKALERLASGLVVLSADEVAAAVGVSTRTLHRRKGAPDAPLSPDQGGRALRFAELLARAAQVFGGQEAAERWFRSAAAGLDRQRPIDLVATPFGVQLVDEFLGRLEHGVYA